MRTHGWQCLLLLGIILGLAGCSGAPPANGRSRPVGDPYDGDSDNGWLQDRLTGRTNEYESQPEPPRGVIPASATSPISTDPTALPPGTPLPDEDADSGFELSDLYPNNVYKGIVAAAGYGPNEGAARALLKEGEDLFKEATLLHHRAAELQQRQLNQAVGASSLATAKFEVAAGKFKSAAKRWPESAIEEDALFLQAESLYFADKYPKAQDTYAGLLTKYSNSRYLDTVSKRMYTIGRYWEKLYEKDPHWPITPNVSDGTRPSFDTLGRALNAYKTISMQDPSGELADDAIIATAEAYFFKKRSWVEAAFYYDMLITEHLKSRHQLRAHLMAVQCQWRLYQGGDYDGAPLEKADRLAAQTITQFQTQLGDELPRLQRLRAEIVEQRAERDYAKAELWAAKRNYRAARIYYQSILEDYPNTRAAQAARGRIQQYRDRAELPTNHFKWMTDLFPQES